MKPIAYIVARLYEARAAKALRAYAVFKAKAEKYFARAGL